MPTNNTDPEEVHQFVEEFNEDDRSTAIVADNSLRIIKYMSLNKFYSLIIENALWFSRIDQFSDEYEGLAVIKASTSDVELFRKQSLVNCWNKYQSESFPLWKIYLGSDKAGVAIVSSVESLMNSIRDPEHRNRITPYIVRYIPHDVFYDGINNMLLITRKKDFYSYEEEIRFNYYSGGDIEQPIGKYFVIDPKALIHKVILSPYMPEWIEKSMRNILLTYGFSSVLVNKSEVRDAMLR